MLHENLKNYRKKKGLSQEQVALQVHVTRQTLSKWEQGTSVPDAETLVNIAEALDVSVSELMGQTIKEESVELGEVAQQLARLNEMMALRIHNQEKTRKTIIRVIYVLIAVVFLASIYSSWNEMWYEFGQNIYNWMH
ncbi:MAG: helix-turn-helix transcriptional regulator [Agathobacter sp.]|nr:helix-turn-helix transcriptional regulator [Agathobacter sp.]